MTVRTRIAPSPTGELHIGTLRTVLYDYAFARKSNGTFVIRMEDTDRNRLVEGSQERLLQTINDYGLNWDEGPEIGGPYKPYIQSERLDIYKTHAKQLIEKGHAYYCFCTAERLQKVREEQQARGLAKTGYDKHCRNLSQEEVKNSLDKGLPHVIRIKIPENESVVLHDVIHGDVEFNSNDVDDMILLKSDGYPTYHLAAMVDDHLMNITHVFRGVEWMPSSPIHIFLYNFFGWEVPIIAHLPNLKEKGMNQKLSKRFGSVDANLFLKEGYLPEATLNLLMFAGWNPGTEKEIYTLEEFIQDFTIEKIQKSDLVVFDRDKLVWYNGYYIRQIPVNELLERIKDWGKKFEIPLKISEDDTYNAKVILLVQERMKTLAEFNELSSYFYEDPAMDKELLTKQTKSSELAKEVLNNLLEIYTNVPDAEWTKEKLDEISHKLLIEKNYKPKEAFMSLRVAVTGATATPPIFDTLEVLGKGKVLKRITASLQALS